MKRVIVLGAGGRDFHDFAMVFRDDPDVRVVAFTAAQIPGIDDRRFPASLAGPTYPEGIPIRPQAELTQSIRAHQVDEEVLAYSDLAYADVMHLSAEAMAAGADFRLLGPDATIFVQPDPWLPSVRRARVPASPRPPDTRRARGLRVARCGPRGRVRRGGHGRQRARQAR